MTPPKFYSRQQRLLRRIGFDAVEQDDFAAAALKRGPACIGQPQAENIFVGYVQSGSVRNDVGEPRCAAVTGNQPGSWTICERAHAPTLMT